MADTGPSLDDFRAFLPTHVYCFMPTGAMWTSSGVNACLKPVPVVDKDGKPVTTLVKSKDKDGKQIWVEEPLTVAATKWLDRHHPVHHMTWAPGYPPLVEHHLIVEGEWIRRNKIHTLNFYRAPVVLPGDAKKAGPWLELVKKIFPDEHEHIILYFAHRVQKPVDKVNHALMLIGSPGIGKDTVLEPLRYAVGPHNFREVSPSQLLGRFNSFLKAVVIRVSEVRDLGDFTRFAFYEHMKPLLASPPSMLRVDEKHIPEYQVINCCGVILTSNHLTNGLYLPADDRRHFVVKSEITKEAFSPEYWAELWGWYADGGLQHVAAYLAALDISKFDAKAPAKKTPAFYAIVDANRSPEESELEDALDGLGRPAALTLKQVIDAEGGMSDFAAWLGERKNRRTIPHRFEAVGYAAARNPEAESGLWVINGVRQVIYTDASLPVSQQLAAARALQVEREKAAAKTIETFAAARKPALRPDLRSRDASSDCSECSGFPLRSTEPPAVGQKTSKRKKVEKIHTRAKGQTGRNGKPLQSLQRRRSRRVTKSNRRNR
jgi:hypothetical protein